MEIRSSNNNEKFQSSSLKICSDARCPSADMTDYEKIQLLNRDCIQEPTTKSASEDIIASPWCTGRAVMLPKKMDMLEVHSKRRKTKTQLYSRWQTLKTFRELQTIAKTDCIEVKHKSAIRKLTRSCVCKSVLCTTACDEIKTNTGLAKEIKQNYPTCYGEQSEPAP